MKEVFVSRAGEKLCFALEHFQISVEGLIACDFGSSKGGFVDCLLRNGAKNIYSVDTSYGELDYKLRTDPRVVVLERTNALHVTLPEKVDFISIDVSWTKQKNILPSAIVNLKEGGQIVSLLKPHYEADKRFLKKGLLEEEYIDEVIAEVTEEISQIPNLKLQGIVESPILGQKGKNREFLLFMKAA